MAIKLLQKYLSFYRKEPGGVSGISIPDTYKIINRMRAY